eukprot:Skav231527  [mRNA]  locus=scaffold84:661570:662643:+ [translate_table: standard]
MPHGNPTRGFLRWQNRCFGHLQKVLNPEHTGPDHNHPTKRFGEQITIVLQVGEDLHASEDCGNIMMAVNGGVSPDPCQDQQPGEGEEDPNEDPQEAVVTSDASHLLLSHAGDPPLHGLFPGVALHHADAKEHLPQRGDPLVHALLQFEHGMAQASTHCH